MVRWGRIDLPELDQLPHSAGTGLAPGQHPLAFGATCHHPTDLRLTAYQSDHNDRGHWHEFRLTPPAGEEWWLDLAVSPRISIRSRVLGQTVAPLSRDAERMLTRDLLLTQGEVYDCDTPMPTQDEHVPQWTEARRDALVLMLFWAVERQRSYLWRDDPQGPFPSTLDFMPRGVPETLHGTFRNPGWGRLSQT